MLRGLMLGMLALVSVIVSPLIARAEIILPSNASWFSFGDSGGGSSAITGTQPRSGDGSLELRGDRTRFGTFSSGDPFAGGSSPGFGLLNNVNSLLFDWQIAVGSISALHPDLTPALRLHVWDPNAVNQRSELIWEGAYNGVYGSANDGVWYTSGATDKFWRFVAGVGQTNDPGIVTIPITQWASGASSGAVQWYSDAAFVYGISIGVGSSAGANYHAFADNVQFIVDNESTTFNFELTDPAAEVPEPASLAVWGLVSIAGAAYGWRKRKLQLAVRA